MRKLSVLIIAVLVTGIFIMADVWLHADTVDSLNTDVSIMEGETEEISEAEKTVEAAETDGSANAVEAEKIDEAITTNEAAKTDEAVKTNEATKSNETEKTDESANIEMNTDILIRNLDKVSDETIRYAYENSPNNIKIGSTYEGNFSGMGKPELLVIFKLLNMPHAGGLDCSVAAVYDKRTLGLITQKTFQYDECKFNVLKDNTQRSYLLFVGSTTYQGYSQYSLGLWKPRTIWEALFQPDASFSDNKKYDLKDNGDIWVSRPIYENTESREISWLHEFNLVWNDKTGSLNEFIPTTYFDEKGNPNVDAVSVSPNGQYAISTLLDKRRVFLYDTVKNILVADFELLAQDFGFLWSPDSSKVCITRVARVWIEASILDVGSKKITELPQLYGTFVKKGVKLTYKLNESRPDPYVSPIEWSPDSKGILFSYQWTDSAYNRQKGSFVFDTVSGGISHIAQNEPDPEGGNTPAGKPKDFRW